MWKLLARNSHGKIMAVWTYNFASSAEHDAALIRKLHKSWKVEVMSAQSLALTRLNG